MPATRLRILALAGLLLAPALGTAQGAHEMAGLGDIDETLAWLASQQGEASFGAARPAYVVEALAQLGRDPTTWPTADADVWSMLAPGDYGDEHTRYMHDARIAHAVGTAGLDATDVHGVDYVARVRDGYVGSAGYLLDDVWLILALRANDVPSSDRQIQQAALTIEAARTPDGGWSLGPASTRAGTDATGMALAALVAADRDVAGDARARAFLDGTYDAATGGHHDPTGSPVNCQSTLWALHGYHALGVAPRPETLAYVAHLRQDDGRYRYTSSSNAAQDAWCTVEALVWLAGAHFPLPHVQNRAPVLAPMPARLVADRAHTLTLSPSATDADGDAVTISWRIGDARGEGDVSFQPASLGNFTLHVVARDRLGAADSRSVHVEVVNLPPRLTNLSIPPRAPPGNVTLAVDADDLDGPPPSVEWRVAGQVLAGAVVATALEKGTHTVEVTATDADGDARTLGATIVVAEDEPPTHDAAPPRLSDVDVVFDGDALVPTFVVEPTDARVRLVIEGAEPVDVRSGARIAWRGDQARGVLVAETASGLVASVEWGPVERATREAPPLAPLVFARAPDALAAGEPALFAVSGDAAEAYRFEWGDGSARAWDASPRAIHAFDEVGVVEVRALARYADGRVSEATHHVLVSVAPPLPEPEPEEDALERNSIEEAVTSARTPSPEELADRRVPAPSAMLAMATLLGLAWLRRRAPSAPR